MNVARCLQPIDVERQLRLGAALGCSNEFGQTLE
jgi:hypothetical protein